MHCFDDVHRDSLLSQNITRSNNSGKPTLQSSTITQLAAYNYRERYFFDHFNIPMRSTKRSTMCCRNIFEDRALVRDRNEPFPALISILALACWGSLALALPYPWQYLHESITN